MRARVRTIIPHCQVDAPVIDAFHCSRCEWSYAIKKPKPFVITYKDAARACREFDEHRCEDYVQRKADEAPHIESPDQRKPGFILPE